jgi:Ca-activated chloride channel family protein
VAQIAARACVRIYPVGIGSPEGAELEVDGFQILTQLNETFPQQIAETTSGARGDLGEALDRAGVAGEADGQRPGS